MSDQGNRALMRLSEADLEELIDLITSIVLAVVRGLDSRGSDGRGLHPPAVGSSPRGGVNRGAEPASSAASSSVGWARFEGAVLVEEEVRLAARRGVKVLRVAASTLISPLALDTAHERGLLIEREA